MIRAGWGKRKFPRTWGTRFFRKKRGDLSKKKGGRKSVASIVLWKIPWCRIKPHNNPTQGLSGPFLGKGTKGKPLRKKAKVGVTFETEDGVTESEGTSALPGKGSYKLVVWNEKKRKKRRRSFSSTQGKRGGVMLH